MKSQGRRHPGRPDPLKDATLVALKRVLDPLLDLMFDAGVTVKDFNKLSRQRAVHVATQRVKREIGRESRSRVAIVTGLPRSEVARILDALATMPPSTSDHHPARRVLAAWHDDPRYVSASGDPSELPIFGKKVSFAQLVHKCGGGIPVRAMLDELLQMDAVKLLPEQRVIAKVRFPVSTGLTRRSILSVGERGKDLLETLAHNIRRRDRPFFEATAVSDEGDRDKATLIRREIEEQGTNFINTVTALLDRTNLKRGRKAFSPTRICRLGVTVFYFQDEGVTGNDVPEIKISRRRKNFRRQTQKRSLDKSPE